MTGPVLGPPCALNHPVPVEVKPRVDPGLAVGATMALATRLVVGVACGSTCTLTDELETRLFASVVRHVKEIGVEAVTVGATKVTSGSVNFDSTTLDPPLLATTHWKA